MAHDPQLSDHERQLEARLRPSADHDDDDAYSDHGDDEYADGDDDGYMGHEQHRHYDDDGGQMDESRRLHGEGEGGDEFAEADDHVDPSFMRLNLNGQQMGVDGQAAFDDGTLPPDPLNDGEDPALAMLARSVGGERGSEDFPVFKIGQTIARTKEVISCVRCDSTNGHVYMGTYTGNLIKFDFTTQREVWRRSVQWQGKAPSITCLDVCKSKLVLGCSSGETLIYDLDTFQAVQCWRDHSARVSAVAFVTQEYPAQSLVYSTSHDGYFLVRDVAAEGKILHSFITCTCPLSALAIESPSSVYLGSWDGQVKRLDLEKKQCTVVLRASALRESPVRALALAPSPPVKKGKKKGGVALDDAAVFVVVVAHGVGEIKSWDMRTGKVHVDAYQGCGDVINALAVFNGLLYAGGDDRSVRVFDVDTGALVEALSGHVNGVTGLAIAGVTPVITPEMAEEAAAAASAAGTQRSGSRVGSGKKDKDKAPARAQGVGNELLVSVGFDCQARAYKVAAIEAAIHLRLLKIEEAKAIAFDAFVASKSKSKKGKSSSRKGSAKGKKKKGSSKKKSSDSSAGSNAGSKSATARTGSANSGTGRASSAASSAAGSAAPAKKKSAKKKGSAKKAKA